MLAIHLQVPKARMIPSTRRGHSPFLSGRHGIDVAAEQVVVPGDRADGESSSADGESIVLPRVARFLGSRARRRGVALYDQSSAHQFNPFPSSHCVSSPARAPYRKSRDGFSGSQSMGAASGYSRDEHRRTEAVLGVALRALEPSWRAERRADRANMISVCWPGAVRRRSGAGRRCGRGVAGGGAGVRMLRTRATPICSARQAEQTDPP